MEDSFWRTKCLPGAPELKVDLSLGFHLLMRLVAEGTRKSSLSEKEHDAFLFNFWHQGPFNQ